VTPMKIKKETGSYGGVPIGASNSNSYSRFPVPDMFPPISVNVLKLSGGPGSVYPPTSED
jgi:hypothetical protein